MVVSFAVQHELLLDLAARLTTVGLDNYFEMRTHITKCSTNILLKIDLFGHFSAIFSSHIINAAKDVKYCIMQ